MTGRHATLDRLAALASAVAAARRLWRPWVRFDPVHRWHVCLWADADHEVWLLCWTAGQRVELHDHGGSAGAFCVADGELVEEHLRPDARGVPRRVRCPAGTARAFPPTRLHAVRNVGPLPATSIHVYSPRLSSMTFYERDGALTLPRRTEHVTNRDEVVVPDAGLGALRGSS